MPYVTVGRENSGDINLYYVDWGTGQPVVFSHGWPLSGDAFEDQMFFLASRGYRCIAHDRRGHGRSSQPWNGNDMDTYADDLAELVHTLDLHDAVHIGHSTGGGEVARYIGRHGTERVAYGNAPETNGTFPFRSEIFRIRIVRARKAPVSDGKRPELYDIFRFFSGLPPRRSEFFLENPKNRRKLDNFFGKLKKTEDF